MKELGCIMQNHCGIGRCQYTSGHQDVCGNCEHYKDIDSGYGKCGGHPPEKHIRLTLFGLKTSYETRIVPWCMKPCALMKVENNKKGKK